MNLPITRRAVSKICTSSFRFLSTLPQSIQRPEEVCPDNFVKITEVGPRDGLQNEKPLPLSTKLELIQRLARTGLSSIEAGSFVSPKWVPQVDYLLVFSQNLTNSVRMADSSKILEHVFKAPPDVNRPVSYSFLVPNERGIHDALSLLQALSSSTQPSNPERPTIEFAVFASATETFSQKNLNCSIATSLERFKPVISAARAANHRVRAYISVVLGCPFEGAVMPSAVASLAAKLLSLGANEIDLGDTSGMGTPSSTMELLKTVSAAGIRNEHLTMHFHDTYGMALVNTAVSLEQGVRKFDGSASGLGGCPYSPGATGNVATEDLLYFIQSLGFDTGIDLVAVAEVGEWISRELERTNGSRVGRALLGRRGRNLNET